MTVTRRFAIIAVSIVALAVVLPFALVYWLACLLVSALAFAGRCAAWLWLRIERAL